jgi:hypothetical protein
VAQVAAKEKEDRKVSELKVRLNPYIDQLVNLAVMAYQKGEEGASLELRTEDGRYVIGDANERIYRLYVRILKQGALAKLAKGSSVRVVLYMIDPEENDLTAFLRITKLGRAK